MQRINLLQILLFRKKLSLYVINNNHYDLLFYFIFMLETFFLASIPSGFHSLNDEGWRGYWITFVFFFVFNTVFYWKYYRGKKRDIFIREIVLLSSVVRIKSFLLVGLFSTVQITIWAGLKLSKIESLSLIYYVMYYAVFSLLMISYKRNVNEVQCEGVSGKS